MVYWIWFLDSLFSTLNTQPDDFSLESTYDKQDWLDISKILPTPVTFPKGINVPIPVINWPIEVTMTAIKEAITQMNPVPSAAQFWKLFNSRYGEVFQARSSERNRLNTFMASLR